MIKILPWGIVVVLVFFCWNQQQQITRLEAEKLEVGQAVIQTKAQKKIITPSSNTTSQYAKNSPAIFQKKKKKRRKKGGNSASLSENESLAEGDIDILVEERAWERVAEIEEEQLQDRMDHISERIQKKVEGWSEEFEWDEEMETQMATILITHMKNRMDFRQKVHSGEMERDEVHQLAEELGTQRNEEIIALIGEEQFQILEEELHHRRPPHR